MSFKIKTKSVPALALSLLLLVMVGPVNALAAGTIDQTLIKAHQFSPALLAAKEKLAGKKEEIPDALTGFKPTVSLDYNIGRQENKIDSSKNYADVNNYALNIDQPIFDGFGNSSAYSKAKIEVKAAEYDFLSATQKVLLEAVTAHINVARNERILKASRKNAASLAKQYKATKERQKLGALTKTDISQAASRLAEANAESSDSLGVLTQSREIYLELVGEGPTGKLHLPDVIAGLPEGKDEAISLAYKENPELLAANLDVFAARETIDEAKSDLWPEVFLRGRMERDHNNGTFRNQKFKNNSITLNVRIPIYEAGQTYSDIRRTKAAYREKGSRYKVIKRRVERQVTNAWSRVQNLKKVIKDRRRSLSAAKKTLKGYNKEYEAGTRTTVDLLDAERDVYRAETALVRAKADHAIMAYRLLAGIGHLKLTPQMAAK